MALWTSFGGPDTYSHEPFMYPLRLRVPYNTDTFRLYAYPAQKPPDTLVQLETGIPAIVAYILGSTWCDQVSAQRMIAVPQQNWTNDDETAIAFRMLRGGGAIIDNDNDNRHWWMLADGFDVGSGWRAAEQKKKYIFGWPQDGGVWVLHLPPLLEKHIKGEVDLDDELEQMQNWDVIAPTVFRDFYGDVHYGDLVESTTMEELCEKLKEKGAMYYQDVKNSPEVVESGLLDAIAAMQIEPVKD
jgi:hypothetical protein